MADKWRPTEKHEEGDHEEPHMQKRAVHPYTTGGSADKTVRDEAAGLRGGPGKEPKWLKDLID